MNVISLVGVVISFILLLAGIFFSFLVFGAEITDRIFGNTFRSASADSWVAIEPTLITLGFVLFVVWIIWITVKILPPKKPLQRLKNLCVFWWTSLFVFMCILVTIQLEIIGISSQGEVGIIVIVLLVVFVLRPFFIAATPGTRLLSLIFFGYCIGKLSWWKIFAQSNLLLFTLPYTTQTWNISLIIASVMTLLPLNMVKRKFFHYYYRWKIENSFFLKTGFRGLYAKSLTLGELAKREFKEIPTFIGITVALGWKPKVNTSKSYHLMTMDTNANMDIYIEGKVYSTQVPHITLGEIMALSGAAIAYRDGSGKDSPLRYWQVMIGFGLGKWISTTFASLKKRVFFYLFPHISVTITGLLAAFQIVDPIYLLVPFGFIFLVCSIGLMLPPRMLQTISELDYFPMLFTELDLVQYGGEPFPPKIEISDGVFGDRVGFLPALARKYENILVCDAVQDPAENCEIFLSMIQRARTQFGCSFVPLKEKNELKLEIDIEADIKAFCDSKKEAVYHLRAYYPEPSKEGRNYSNLILIKARKVIVDRFKDEFDSNLHGCLCECCHTKNFEWTKGCLGEFPQHVNPHQFFTPKMFRNYSDLGYRTTSIYFEKKELYF